MRKYSRPYLIYIILTWVLLIAVQIHASERVGIHVDNPAVGAPLTFGVPFAQGDLLSPDHIRVLDLNGVELPSQTTLVSTWEPVDYSVKWVWVFFFSKGAGDYILEYGPDVTKALLSGDIIKIKNAQRQGQTSHLESGPLRFSINKKTGGFIDNVLLDSNRDGFDAADTIAVVDGTRGSFLDLLDDLGIDKSTAHIHRTVREKGSGPLHAIIRIEGTYTYQRDDNRDSPFVIRIHLYAGQSYIRVLHTMTYTGISDKHKPREGQHANIALSEGPVKNDDESADEGWMQPNDQIASMGLSLIYKLGIGKKFTTEYNKGKWYEEKGTETYEVDISSDDMYSIFQNGPKPNRVPPVPNSDTETRIDGFAADIKPGTSDMEIVERAKGWVNVQGSDKGVAVGIKNFFKEYPKEINYNSSTNEGIAYLWSPLAGPLSFERASMDRDQGMIANFAEGITKTSELVYYFHSGGTQKADIKRVMNYFLDPSVPHVDAEFYSKSQVYGNFVPRNDQFEEYERSIDYKMQWQLFNQKWEPWYGMLDYGDQKNIYYKDNWYRWQNNEPAIDFMYWLQFMRTGNSEYYHAAESMSRHTMDVDNVHWPVDPVYYGDTNDAQDIFNMKAKESVANPYLGIGRRHAKQQWGALLSAHVWVQGWLASYYLTGYHRGLDIAKLTADSYTRRMWGEHGITGRRLYLSLWNLVEVWDATKDPRYLDELKSRVDKTLYLQNGADQYDNLVIDRYGYSQVYVSHGLYKYYQLTGEERIKQSLIRHARAVRDNPPFNHEYESYLATIHSLLVGYEYTGEKSFLIEAKKRSTHLKSGELSKSFASLGDQKSIAQELENISRLPKKGHFANRARWVSNWSPIQGLRVFGWTHIYNIPWLISSLEDQE